MIDGTAVEARDLVRPAAGPLGELVEREAAGSHRGDALGRRHRPELAAALLGRRVAAKSLLERQLGLAYLVAGGGHRATCASATAHSNESQTA